MPRQDTLHGPSSARCVVANTSCGRFAGSLSPIAISRDETAPNPGARIACQALFWLRLRRAGFFVSVVALLLRVLRGLITSCPSWPYYFVSFVALYFVSFVANSSCASWP